MEVFPFIFVLILASTCSAFRVKFKNCAQIGDGNQLNCEIENSRLTAMVEEETVLEKNGSDIVEHLTPTGIWMLSRYYIFHCDFPENITLSNDTFSEYAYIKSLKFNAFNMQGSPKPFINYHYLESLNFECNGFTEFPREYFANIPSLKTISLHRQHIRKLSKNSFRSITMYLENLQVSNSKLRTIEPATFLKFTSLRTLNLNSNELEILKPEIFHGLSRLELLDLEGNHIGAIKPRTFDSMTALDTIYLSENQLDDDWPSEVFTHLTNLNTIEMHGNKMNTDPRPLLEECFKLKRYTWGPNKITVGVHRYTLGEKIINFFIQLHGYSTMAEYSPWPLETKK